MAIDKTQIQLGKKLAHCLRHAPEVYGITLGSDGSASVSDICEAFNITLSELESVVSSDDKGRYVMQADRIWAAQGHTLKVSVPLRIHSPSGKLFHGTKADSVASIMRDGILPGKRLYVHLSTTVETAEIVASRRKGDDVILVIDAEALALSGEKMWESSNGVVLVDRVAPEFIAVLP